MAEYLIREERPGDGPGLRRLIATAFGSEQESRLVDALRESGDLVHSLVAVSGGTLIGHVGLSHMPSPSKSLALAPLAVHADRRKRGVGTALVKAALERAEDARVGAVFVFGAPAYYERFGFSVAAAADFPSPYSGPHFMVRKFGPCAAGPAIHAPAFADLA